MVTVCMVNVWCMYALGHCSGHDRAARDLSWLWTSLRCHVRLDSMARQNARFSHSAVLARGSVFFTDVYHMRAHSSPRRLSTNKRTTNLHFPYVYVS